MTNPTADTHLEVQGDKVLEKLGDKLINTKDYKRVLAGFKATLKSERTSDEAKLHAQEMIAALEAAERESLASIQAEEEHADDVHQHHVVGGMKASLKNPHVSEETKDAIRDKLDEMGERHA